MPLRSLLHAFIATVVAATIAVGAGASTAQATGTRPCISGTTHPACTTWTGKVTFVADGDTIDVDIAGDRTSRPARVRITGIQAMELTRYSSTPSKRRGECHALAATARVDRLIRMGHGTVRLAAQRRSSQTGGRIRRAVSTKINGHWVDIAATLVAEGLALWLPNSVEYAWNRRYSTSAEQAAGSGLGIWNKSSCGQGPGDEQQLRLWVKWDADGVDQKNVNGEWAKIKNLDQSRDISLAGWWFRDSHHRRYTFPQWARIGAGQTITVHIGRGSSAGDQFFWGLRKPVFENASGGRRAMGDGAYLFDPQGDLRASMTYPCRTSCQDPLAGAVTIAAQPTGNEYVVLRNVSGSLLDLEGTMLENSPVSYVFGPRTVLAPGKLLVVRVGGSSVLDTLGIKNWGLVNFLLNDAGDVVKLRNFAGTTLACVAWGNRSC